MANSDASSSTTCTVRVLVSFYLAATDDSSSARTLNIHKEKFKVPLSGDENKDLFNFGRHLKTFTGLAEIAKSKGLGENPEVTIAKRQAVASRRSHSELKMPGNIYEFDTLIKGNGMLQGTSNYVMSCNIFYI